MTHDARETLIAVNDHFNGNWDEVYSAISTGITIPEEWHNVCSSDLVTFVDTNYPDKIRKTLNKPPFVIRYRGDITLLSPEKKHIAVLSSRGTNPVAVLKAEEDLNALPEDYVPIIINDQVVADLDKHKTILVKAAGLNKRTIGITATMEKHILENGGLIISLWPDDRETDQTLYPIRNLFVGSLCEGVLVVALQHHSGGLVTIMQALNIGTPIMVYPTAPKMKELENNQLIKEGADLVEDAQDIINLLLK